jgi:hypothetical protein
MFTVVPDHSAAIVPAAPIGMVMEMERVDERLELRARIM